MAKPQKQYNQPEEHAREGELDQSSLAVHIPVLLEPILEHLPRGPESTIIDCTLGQGGHSRALSEGLSEKGTLIGFDVDTNSLELARGNLSELKCRKILVHSNFGNISKVLEEKEIGQADIILADLGFSSAQIEDPSRGMSFQHDGPLDMRLACGLEGDSAEHLQTAADLVNRLGEKELADMIYQYGEERKSRRIAAAIVEQRRKKRIETTSELAELIVKVVGFGPRGKNRKRKPIHPATRTFQALRIAVNDELGQLERLLEGAKEILAPGGRVAIISFHSLEDRIVKYNFRENKAEKIYEILTKKPIIANEAEVALNPRSRSAKLRIAEKQ